MQVTANGVLIEVEESGAEGGAVVLLTRGLGTQLVHWPDDFVEGLVGLGYRVVRYDNRDCGLSQKMGPCGTDNIVPAPVYDLFDMAKDGIAVLDSLGIARAHVLGISMGGMIAQIMAARYPDRTESLISVMSSAGEKDFTRGASPQALQALVAPWPLAADRQRVIAKWIDDSRVFSSRTYPFNEEESRAGIIASIERCYCPGGIWRQYSAIINSGERQDMLASISCPALVLHGDEDPLIPPASGRRAARLIPAAEFHLVKGMGHDMPGPLISELVACIHAHCQKR